MAPGESLCYFRNGFFGTGSARWPRALETDGASPSVCFEANGFPGFSRGFTLATTGIGLAAPIAPAYDGRPLGCGQPPVSPQFTTIPCSSNADCISSTQSSGPENSAYF